MPGGAIAAYHDPFISSVPNDHRRQRKMEGYRNIAIIGASGLLGKPLVKQLAKAGFQLTLISRDSSKLKEIFGLLDGVKFKEVESTNAKALKEAFTGLNFCRPR